MIYDAGGTGDYMLIGTIGRARGLNGHVRVRPFTDDPARFYDLTQAWVLECGKYTAVWIDEAEVNGETVHLRLRGVVDRTAAEALNGKSLYVRRQEAVELPEGSHFITDVIGCSVADDSGRFLGKLCEVMQPGAADVYVLRGGPDGEVLFPALKSVIQSIDTTAKRIVVNAARFKEVAVFED